MHGGDDPSADLLWRLVQWRSSGVGMVGKVQWAPSAGAPEFQAKNVHVGETFNRFADFGL